MARMLIALINFYQRFISPFKGFKCAHNAVHRQGSCSHSVKQLISQYGIIRALPMIRLRFKECGSAYSYIKDNRAAFNKELACDLGCDAGLDGCLNLGDCSDVVNSECVTSSCDFFAPCDLLPDLKKTSRRTKVSVVLILFISLLTLSYYFYGRTVETIYVVDNGEQNQSLLTRLSQRDQPELRLVLIIGNKKFYSDIIKIEENSVEYVFTLNKTFHTGSFDKLEVHDARSKLASSVFGVGQVLERFESPGMKGQGERFSYRMKRRWHFD